MALDQNRLQGAGCALLSNVLPTSDTQQVLCMYALTPRIQEIIGKHKNA